MKGWNLSASCRSLAILDLRGVDVKDAGMTKLAAVKSLRELNLSDGRFTDKGLAQLAALPNLERLAVTRVRLTEKGIESLAGIPDFAGSDAGLPAGYRQSPGVVEDVACSQAIEFG